MQHRPDCLQDIETRQTGHHDIQQHQIRSPQRQHFQSSLATVGSHDFVATAHQHPGQNLAVDVIIVDDQNDRALGLPANRCRAGVRATGLVIPIIHC